uniref:Uncharacterized protein n=1 Tax=Nothobranchius rachovii TaxID=451742 RepID=A0A1A8NS63_9TELE
MLSGECRSDSLGHCSKYGSYTIIEERLNKVIDVHLVQSSEVLNSSWCELEGLKRSIRPFSDNDMSVYVLVTDRNRQVAKWVREQLGPQGTRHFYDVWHCGKGLPKKLDTVSRESGCEDLVLWRQSIVNHLWTAASTPDANPDLMEAKWKSLVNHAQDIHKHGIQGFPSCLHPPLVGQDWNKQWLIPDCCWLLFIITAMATETWLEPRPVWTDMQLAIHALKKVDGLCSQSKINRLMSMPQHYSAGCRRPTTRTLHY